MRALRNPDASTALHEFSHIFQADIYDGLGKNGFSEDDAQHIEDWAGVRNRDAWRANAIVPENREAHEKFARGFERYVMEGEAPTPTLARAFQYLKNVLAQIYQHVRGTHADPSRVSVSPEVRAVFDRLLGAGLPEGTLKESFPAPSSGGERQPPGDAAGVFSPWGAVTATAPFLSMSSGGPGSASAPQKEREDAASALRRFRIMVDQEDRKRGLPWENAFALSPLTVGQSGFDYHGMLPDGRVLVKHPTGLEFTLPAPLFAEQVFRSH